MKEPSRFVSYIGHSFSWFFEPDYLDEPPPTCRCTHCGVEYQYVGNVNNFCVGAWSRNHKRVTFVRALQSPGGML